MNDPLITVWYDGACPLCIREIALMRRLDRAGKIRFLNLIEDAVICPVDRDLMLSRLHAKENGQLLSGAAAFAAMWRAIPYLRPIGLIAQNRLILMILEILYRLFLKIRPYLKRLF